MGSGWTLDAIRWALEVEPDRLDQGARWLLIRLADGCDRNYECFPSRKRLMAQCRMSENTLRKHMQSLEGLGLVTRIDRLRDNGSRTSNLYRLAIADIAAPRKSWGEPPAKVGGAAPAIAGGANNKASRSSSVAKATSDRARAMLGAAWDSFVDYRKAKKKPLTDLAVSRLLNQLEAWTDLDPVEVIAWTMLRGWEAPYRPKDYDLEAHPQLRRKVEASAPAARAFKPVATESEEATRIREKLWRLAEPDAYDRWLATVGIAVKDGTVTVYAPGKLEATHLRSDGRIDGWLRAACLGVLGRDNWQRIEILGLEPVA